MDTQNRSIEGVQEKNGNDSDGSDYEVDWQLKPKPAKITKTDQFPLPSEVEKNLQKSSQGTTYSDDSDDEDVGELPTLTTQQISAILETVKNNKRLVLMVNNVNFTTAKEEIEAHFEPAGRVKGVRIPRRRSSGFAFVEMLDPVGFQKAFLLDGSYLDGRKISVNLSESGKKKCETRIKLLMKKNAEIRKLRKKNKNNPKATDVSLVPEVTSNKTLPPPDKFLNKPKAKMLSKKQAKQARNEVSLKTKFKNLAKKGLRA